MADIDDSVVRYAKRHFKWSEVERIIGPLDYSRIFLLAGDSGLQSIDGLSLYTNNSLWERRD